MTNDDYLAKPYLEILSFRENIAEKVDSFRFKEKTKPRVWFAGSFQANLFSKLL